LNKTRVLVIDDSAFSRRTIVKLLEEIPGVEVVGYAVNGEEGLRKVMDIRPDLITMDLEMPGMDGFTPVIVVSSHSEDERVFKALELGAVDFVAKPRRALSEQLLEIRDELQHKVGALLNINLQGLKKRTQHVDRTESLPVKKIVKLPRSGSRKFDVVAIGSSTGGPPALQKILLQMPAELPFCILISQHMPSGFTRTFAERLNRMLPFEVKEAADGDVVLPNQVLVAPGGVNMITVQMRDQVVVRLKTPTKDEKYIPSVNAMLNSVARVYGSRALVVILTGMGNDGSIGVRKVKEAGGAVVAEAEESSVVFGMPREAIATGVVDNIVHLDQMASKILELCGFR
jgi:two-component system chemotaxis response regulator CheB